MDAWYIMLVSIYRCFASILQIEDRDLVWIASYNYSRRVSDRTAETPSAIVLNIFKNIFQFNALFFKQIFQKKHSYISSKINCADKLLIITLYKF